MDWFAGIEADGRMFMLDIVTRQSALQSRFITDLKQLVESDSIDAALAMLLNPRNPQLLGLSEKIIQSIWVGEIEFPDALLFKIRECLSVYGISFFYHPPTLVRSSFDAFTIASSIGKLQVQPADDADKMWT